MPIVLARVLAALALATLSVGCGGPPERLARYPTLDEMLAGRPLAGLVPIDRAPTAEELARVERELRVVKNERDGRLVALTAWFPQAPDWSCDQVHLDYPAGGGPPLVRTAVGGFGLRYEGGALVRPADAGEPGATGATAAVRLALGAPVAVDPSTLIVATERPDLFAGFEEHRDVHLRALYRIPDLSFAAAEIEKWRAFEARVDEVLAALGRGELEPTAAARRQLRAFPAALIGDVHARLTAAEATGEEAAAHARRAAEAKRRGEADAAREAWEEAREAARVGPPLEHRPYTPDPAYAARLAALSAAVAASEPSERLTALCREAAAVATPPEAASGLRALAGLVGREAIGSAVAHFEAAERLRGSLGGAVEAKLEAALALERLPPVPEALQPATWGALHGLRDELAASLLADAVAAEGEGRRATAAVLLVLVADLRGRPAGPEGVRAKMALLDLARGVLPVVRATGPRPAYRDLVGHAVLDAAGGWPIHALLGDALLAAHVRTGAPSRPDAVLTVDASASELELAQTLGREERVALVEDTSLSPEAERWRAEIVRLEDRIRAGQEEIAAAHASITVVVSRDKPVVTGSREVRLPGGGTRTVYDTQSAGFDTVYHLGTGRAYERVAIAQREIERAQAELERMLKAPPPHRPRYRQEVHAQATQRWTGRVRRELRLSGPAGATAAAHTLDVDLEEKGERFFMDRAEALARAERELDGRSLPPALASAVEQHVAALASAWLEGPPAAGARPEDAAREALWRRWLVRRAPAPESLALLRMPPPGADDPRARPERWWLAARLPARHPGWRDAAFDPTGQFFAVTEPHAVRLLRAHDLGEVRSFPTERPAAAVALDPGALRIGWIDAEGGPGNAEVSFVSTKTGAGHRLAADVPFPVSIAICREGRQFRVGGMFGNVTRSDIAGEAPRSASYQMQEMGRVSGLAVTPDGRYEVQAVRRVADMSQRLRVLDLQEGRVLFDIEHEAQRAYAISDDGALVTDGARVFRVAASGADPIRDVDGFVQRLAAPRALSDGGLEVPSPDGRARLVFHRDGALEVFRRAF